MLFLYLSLLQTFLSKQLHRYTTDFSIIVKYIGVCRCCFFSFRCYNFLKGEIHKYTTDLSIIENLETTMSIGI